jgi:hypothetical protein
VTDDLTYDDELEALKDAVNRLGGSKSVGAVLWPEKTPDSASRYLLDALNPTRSERLNPGQVLLIMRMAREAGFHNLAAFFMREAGYAPPVPLSPATEAEKLIQGMEQLMSSVQKMAGRLEHIRSGMGEKREA